MIALTLESIQLGHELLPGLNSGAQPAFHSCVAGHVAGPDSSTCARRARSSVAFIPASASGEMDRSTRASNLRAMSERLVSSSVGQRSSSSWIRSADCALNPEVLATECRLVNDLSA